jgi:tetratricopeptide (TPR) repeat protein
MWPGLAAAQAPDPKTAFIRALADFSLDLRGTFGDEGTRLAGDLQAMRTSLEQWDAGIAAFASSMAAERTSAAPALAARMHLAMGAIYLDRGRVADAVREFQAGAAADGSRADVQALLALAHERAGNSAAALAAASRAATLDAKSPSTAYLAARRLRTAGRAADADAALRRAIELVDARLTEGAPAVEPFVPLGLVPETPNVDPFFPPALHAKGFALLAAGDYEGAVRSFAESVATDPLGAPAGAETGAMRRAAAALRNGAVQTAIQQLTLAITLEPDRSEPHRLLAYAYTLDEAFDRARLALETASRLNDGDERILLQLADISVRKEDFTKALELLAGAGARRESGRTVYELGLAYQRAGRYREAIDRFEASLGFGPLLGANSIYQTLGSLRRADQQFEEAATAFEQRVALIPNDPAAHEELGETYARLGRHTDALGEFSMALLLDPARITSHIAAAQIYLRDGRFEDAARASRRALSLDGGHREARYVLATSLVRLGRDEEGRKELAIVQQQQAEDASTRARIFELEGYKREAAVSAAAGDHAKAIALLRNVVAADPKQIGPHLDLGNALAEAQQFAEAVSELRQAASLGAPLDVHRRLADALAALGDSAESERERATYERLKQEELKRELQR